MLHVQLKLNPSPYILIELVKFERSVNITIIILVTLTLTYLSYYNIRRHPDVANPTYPTRIQVMSP